MTNWKEIKANVGRAFDNFREQINMALEGVQVPVVDFKSKVSEILDKAANDNGGPTDPPNPPEPIPTTFENCGQLSTALDVMATKETPVFVFADNKENKVRAVLKIDKAENVQERVIVYLEG